LIQYTRELVLKKVSEMFPHVDLAEVLNILDQYGYERRQPERERVQLAILKLSEGNVVKLQREVETARQDYRDALLYAEYPDQARADKSTEAIIEQDRAQYLQWLYNQD
jgi:hypothetical protein